MKAQLRLSFLTLAMMLAFVMPAMAYSDVFELPEPTLDYARQYDDFYSYSGQFFLEIDYPDFNIDSGTGTEDLKLLTGGDVKNPVGFEDAVKYNNVDGFEGLWSVSVDTLLNYFRDLYGPEFSTPVFVFDLNQSQSQGSDSLRVSSLMTVTNSDGGVEDFWAFDNIKNDEYDSGDDGLVYVPGSIEGLPNPLTDPVEYVDIDNNEGSGKGDFIVYSDTMTLDQFYGDNFFFNVYFRFEDLNNGFEELYLTGAYSPTSVPEPNTAFLICFGILFLAYGIRRKRGY